MYIFDINDMMEGERIVSMVQEELNTRIAPLLTMLVTNVNSLMKMLSSSLQ